MEPQFAIQTCDDLLAEWRSTSGEETLSHDESLRARAIVSDTRREQFLAGRWLAKTLLGKALGGAPGEWRISSDPHTKPHVVGHRVDISIAHSGCFVACALADKAVGIDIERMLIRRPTLEMARWVCSSGEQFALQALAPDAAMREFNAMWTRKEARLKQHELPFDLDTLKAIEVTPADVACATGGTWFFAEQGMVVSLAAAELMQLRMHWPAHWSVDAVQWHRYV